MKKLGILAGVAGLALTAVLAASNIGSADDSKLEQLKAQGFARLAIANEPPLRTVSPPLAWRSDAMSGRDDL
ncbi:hypothetical protein LB567_26670, partial [Mesorhizobium sp. B264B1A]|nr:hypothetical protein [Mesorhizobium sp. B264B1A]